MNARTIRIFTTREAADLAAANLQAHGIQCWVQSDDAGGTIPSLAGTEGVRLIVRPEDEETAKDLLSEEE